MCNDYGALLGPAQLGGPVTFLMVGQKTRHAHGAFKNWAAIEVEQRS